MLLECPNSVLLICEHNTLHSGLAIRSKCGCWACPYCGINLRVDWLAKAAQFLASLSMVQYSVCTTGHAFEALARRLRKTDRLYYRIRIGAVSHVFHAPLLKTRQYTPDESTWLNPVQALEKFNEILYLAGVSRVSCSRALVPPKPAKVVTDWKRRAVKRQTINQTNQWLAMVKVDVVVSHAKAFDGRVLDVLLLRDCPVFSPHKPTDPCISVPASGGVGKSWEPRTTQPASDESEPCWDSIRTALLVT